MTVETNLGPSNTYGKTFGEIASYLLKTVHYFRKKNYHHNILFLLQRRSNKIGGQQNYQIPFKQELVSLGYDN